MSFELPKMSDEVVPGWTIEEIITLVKLGFFDNDFYVSTNPDVALSGVNPLMHYLQLGWRERRQPSPKIRFSEVEFLDSIQMYLRNPLFIFELNR